MKIPNDHSFRLIARTELHRHFCCQKFGNVIDIETEDPPARELAGHLIEGGQVYYPGVCADCR